MAMKFEKIVAGTTLYDRHKTKMGSTRLTQMGQWSVHIISVNPENRSAVVSWNGNQPESWSERRLSRLFAKKAVKKPRGESNASI